MHVRRDVVSFLVVGLVAVLTGCGGGASHQGVQKGREARSSSVGTAGAGALVTITAGEFFLHPKELSAPAGPIRFEYKDEGKLGHTLLIEGVSGFKLAVAPGAVTDGTVSLRPGVYKLFCDIPGHRAAGMEATLTVR